MNAVFELVIMMYIEKCCDKKDERDEGTAVSNDERPDGVLRDDEEKYYCKDEKDD